MELRGLSDRDLVTKVLNSNGDIDYYFNEIFRRYYGKLIRVARGIVNDEDTVKDIVQESLIKAYKNLSSYNPKFAFSTWVYTIAQNTARTSLRDRVSKNSVGMEGLFDLQINSSHYPDMEFEVKEDIKAVESLISRLPDELREPLMLKVYSGYGYTELAEVLNISLGTVKSRVYKARGILRSMISNT